MEDLPGEPRCPTDQIVMRDIPGGWACPSCGYRWLVKPVQVPRFDGPGIRGG